MHLTTLLNRLWKNVYFRHSVLAALTITVVILCTLLWLNIITQHGVVYPVPDFTNMKVSDAEIFAKEHHVTIIVSDSEYVASKRRGVILDQNPKPQTQVKSNRKVFVRINSQRGKTIIVPAVVNMSLRQAKTILEHGGLVVGRLSFSSDLAHGIVLSQLHNGNPVAAGAKLPTGSRIDLEIGQNKFSNTKIPALTNLPLNAARSAIIEAMLNVGRISYSSSVKTAADSLNAVVYAQFPTAASDPVPLGTFVDIVLSAGTEAADAEDEEAKE